MYDVAPAVVTFEKLPLADGALMARSTAPMSAAMPWMRGKPLPRWSVARLAGLLPASMAGLVAPSACVGVAPPLLSSGPRSRSVLYGRLLALAAVSVKPLLTLMALRVAVSCAAVIAAMSERPLGWLAEFPDTIVLCRLTTGIPRSWIGGAGPEMLRPPPPWPSAVLVVPDVLFVIVEF